MTTSLYAFKTDSDEGNYEEFSYEASYEYDDSDDGGDDGDDGDDDSDDDDGGDY